MNQNTSLFEQFISDPVEFNLLILKSKLVAVIVSMIREKNWTQKNAAIELGVTQPRISNLFVGRLEKFSIDFLIELVVKLGYKLELDYTPWNVDQPINMALKKAVF